MNGSSATWWEDPHTEWTSGQPARVAQLLAAAYQDPSSINRVARASGLDYNSAQAAGTELDVWTGLLREPYRPRVFSTRNPFSVGTYLVDGVVAGAWSINDGRIVLDPFADLSTADRRAVEREREALEAFHA